MADPDWADPCAFAAWLRPLVAKLAVGQGVVRVRSGANRETQYGPADLKAAQTLLAQKEAECAAKNGACTGRRRAITFG